MQRRSDREQGRADHQVEPSGRGASDVALVFYLFLAAFAYLIASAPGLP